MDPEIVTAVALALATSGVAKTAWSIVAEYVKRRKQSKVKISTSGEQVEIDLEKPEQAKLYVATLISKAQEEDGGQTK